MGEHDGATFCAFVERVSGAIAARTERGAREIKVCTLNILVVDIGGTSVKILATGQTQVRKTPSGPEMTPQKMVSDVKKLAGDWKYDVLSIGYPGPVLRDRPAAEPRNLGKGWMGFDFAAAFERPARVMNDAAIQAIGSYGGGRMLFLGLGTGLGSTLIVNDVVVPMELGHLPYKQGTYEDYVGRSGLRRYGKNKWRKNVADVVACLTAAFGPDEVVLGGGNTKKLTKLPALCRLGDNANAFKGGFRLWETQEEQVESRIVSHRRHAHAGPRHPKDGHNGTSRSASH